MVSFQEQTENWDDEENDTAGATTRSTNYYFKAVPYTDSDNQKSTYYFSACCSFFIYMCKPSGLQGFNRSSLVYMYIAIVSVLKVLVDKRMFLGTLKKDLEPYIGVPVEYFKIYRLNTGQQEFECARLTENLGSYRDDEKLTIRLDRMLRKGEHRGKVFQLLPNSPEVILAVYSQEVTNIDIADWCCYSKVCFAFCNC